ncbi:MAG: hypothetical protein HFF13_04750 [Angelakisella sp.]|jgi:hypothetical protein|nr:hypothetical protein [Angelakisella sp.]
MYLREKYVQYSVPHYGNTNGCFRQCLWKNFVEELRFCRSANFPVFQKSRRREGEKSAGTVRSRRMKFCEKGFGGGATNKQKLISGVIAGNQF